MKYLLDSNILIYYLNGDVIVQKFIEKHQHQCAISLINYYEVLNYDFTTEEQSIVKTFLQSFVVIEIDLKIVNQSLILKKIKKIKMADVFLFATAQLFELTLVTRNIKDFPDLPEKLFNPFKDKQ